MLTDESNSTATLTGARPSGAEPTASFPAPANPPLSGTRVETASCVEYVVPTTAAPAPPHVPGYALEDQLGAGGMGVVVRARDLAFDRAVAVKMLRDDHPADSGAARRFVNEARITGQLQHPSIPPAHHLGTLPDGRPFLVMKLVKGCTLGDLLTNEPDDHWKLVSVFAQVCQAVAYAHSRGVIHRDLKPSNVMVGAFGEVQVMDWGLAKVLGDEPIDAPADHAVTPPSERTSIRVERTADDATRAGSVMGTPAYMSPEQAAGALDQVDERADVFALGAVLCAILTGAPPYAGATTEAVRARAVLGETNEAFIRLDACGQNPELVALCKRCLAREREDRPRDAGEVTQTLAAILASADQYARQAELERIRAANELARLTAAERARRNRRTRLAGLITILVLVVSGGSATITDLWLRSEYAKKAEDSPAMKRATEETEYAKRAADAAKLGTLGEATRTGARELRLEKHFFLLQKQVGVIEYGRSIEAAREELSNGNVEAARALLAQTAPALRGWEWEYLNRPEPRHSIALKGHTSAVTSAAFSPDGNRIVTGSDDKTARVWDTDKGQELLTLRGHAGEVTGVCFSPDAKRIVTGSGDQTALWDAEKGQQLFALKGHTSEVTSVAFSPDGKRILTGSQDSTAKVWDAEKGTEVLALKGHTGAVTSVAFGPEGNRIVTGSDDKTAKVWNADTGQELLVLKGHTKEVTSVRFSPDGDRIVTTSLDKTAVVWDARTGQELVALAGSPDELRSAAFSPDGRRIVTGGRDRATRVWDAGIGVLLLTLRNHTGAVTGVSFSPDGSRLASASADGTTQVWDARLVLELAPPPREVKRPDAP